MTQINRESPLWEKTRHIMASGLSTAEKLLLIALADYGGLNGAAFPSQQRLASDLSMSDRQVRNVITKLKRSGVLETHKKQRVSEYVVQWSKLPPRPEVSCQSETGSEVPVSDSRPEIYDTQTGSQFPTNKERTDKEKKTEDRLSVFEKSKARKFNQWCSRLTTDDFRELDRGWQHFQSAVSEGLLREFEDRNWFLVLWLDSWRKFQRGVTDNAAKLFIGNVKRVLAGGPRFGTEQDEDIVQDFLQAKRRPRNRSSEDAETEPQHISELFGQLLTNARTAL